MFRKVNGSDAGGLRFTKRALIAALTTLMLSRAAPDTATLRANSYPQCPTISISCPTDQVVSGMFATVTVQLSGADPNTPITYNWTISAGTITSGQGTPTITIDTTGQAGQNITATVEIGGLPSECDRIRSCSFPVALLIHDCMKFDEYSNLKFNDEKLRLDNLASQLQQMPAAQGYYFIFGSCEGEADLRSQRAVNYLVNTRRIDRNRLSVTNGGCRETLTVELWICDLAPTPSNIATVDPCPKCKAKPKVLRGARRRGKE